MRLQSGQCQFKCKNCIRHTKFFHQSININIHACVRTIKVTPTIVQVASSFLIHNHHAHIQSYSNTTQGGVVLTTIVPQYFLKTYRSITSYQLFKCLTCRIIWIACSKEVRARRQLVYGIKHPQQPLKGTFLYRVNWKSPQQFIWFLHLLPSSILLLSTHMLGISSLTLKGLVGCSLLAQV